MGPKGIAAKVHVGARHDHAHPPVGQHIRNLADTVVHELGLVDGHDLASPPRPPDRRARAPSGNRWPPSAPWAPDLGAELGRVEIAGGGRERGSVPRARPSLRSLSCPVSDPRVPGMNATT